MAFKAEQHGQAGRQAICTVRGPRPFFPCPKTKALKSPTGGRAHVSHCTRPPSARLLLGVGGRGRSVFGWRSNSGGDGGSSGGGAGGHTRILGLI